MAAEPPVQTLSVTDLHGVVWDFRHIYRGTPRRHLLTTGWSKFVNHKMLVAGDSVVFMRNSRGEMFVGVRRAVRSTVSSDCASRWSSHIGGGATTTMRLKTEDQEGSGRKVMSAEAVVGAAEMAAAGRPFEVVYYPKAGWSDFVVKAEVVEKALNVFWSAGMRVKMSVETEDSSRMTWFQGTLSSVSIPDNGPWQRSHGLLSEVGVTWDEPEVLQNAKRRFRAPMSPGLLTNAEEEFFFPVPGAPNSTMGQLNASLLNYNTFPAGMQGARQDLYCVSNLSHLLSENTPQMCPYNSFGNNVVPKLKRVSTELNIGSSQSDELSLDSQSSVHSFGTELDGNRYCNSTKVGRSSFQLFGKIIHMNQPVEGGFDDVGCTEDNGNKGYNATEGLMFNIKEPQLLKLVLCELLVAATTKVSVRCSRWEKEYNSGSCLALKAGRKLTSLTVAVAIYRLMANSLFLPNHSFIAPPRLSASLSSKSSKPLPLPRLGFSLNNSTSIISQSSSSSSSRSGSISRSRRASSFKSHLAPRDSVPPTNAKEDRTQSNVEASESGADQHHLPRLGTLLQVYKEAIFNGDKETVSEVEAKIAILENEKNKLVKKVSSSSAEITSGKEKFIRLQADFDNCRKRFEKERLRVRTDAQGEVIESLLTMVDNFERAKQYIKPETDKEKKIDASYQGIYKQLVETMKSLHVAVVPTVGKSFESFVCIYLVGDYPVEQHFLEFIISYLLLIPVMLHEAVAREESQEFKEGIIIQEIRRGFLLEGRLLRPAMVKVSTGPGSKKAPVATEKSSGLPATAAGKF
ncbi:Co-chaperone GrpE family protein [Prunus dulcis]|uniref:Auxin response factor n=1 Tax=Prunus dulcis TaxID=3755 RepID=A0A4Y1QV28_PRUDU|nr:Co-chaperone GrpE family protein [Prunus dulcis]